MSGKFAAQLFIKNSNLTRTFYTNTILFIYGISRDNYYSLIYYFSFTLSLFFFILKVFCFYGFCLITVIVP